MPLEQTRRMAVAGIGMTAVGRSLRRTPLDLSADALRLAVGDAGLRHTDVNGLISNVGDPLVRRVAPAVLPDLRSAVLAGGAGLSSGLLDRRGLADGSGRGTVTSWVRFHKRYYEGAAVPDVVVQVTLDSGPRLTTSWTGANDPRAGEVVTVSFRHLGRGAYLPEFGPADRH